MNIQKININKLIPATYNPRKDLTAEDEEYQKIKKSIIEFGYVAPVIINNDMTVIGGHQRLKVLQELDYSEIECIVVELDKVKEKALNVALNKINGEWDNEKLEVLLEELQAEEIDISVTGFSFEEIEDIFQKTFEPEQDNFDVEDALEEITEPKTKLGDIWILGNHRLMCGDSTDVDSINKLLNNQNCAITFHSPPYNVGHNLGYDNDNKYLDYNDNNQQYLELLIKSTDNALQNSRYVFVNLQFLSNNKIDIISFLEHYKNNFVDILFWKKSQVAPAMANNVLNSQVECIFVFSLETNKRAINTGNFRGTISNYIETSSNSKNEFSNIHNAGFPVSFATFFVNNFSKQNDVVIDLFGGTGTTMVACEQLNRICYMMELDPKYCDVVVARWEDLTGEKAQLLNNG